jgi:hypothetical protein
MVRGDSDTGKEKGEEEDISLSLTQNTKKKRIL